MLRRRSTWLGLIALTTASFALFAATCARTVTGEDSGELVSAAYLVGVAHPPGYPLWCMLAKLATFIPVGEVALRVALVSALFGALTVGCIAANVLLLTRSWPAAVAASLGFGLMRDQWSQTTIAEVYTLNTFFLAACILLLLLWSERLSWRLFYLFAFTYGLSLTNHLTMLGAAPPFLLFIFIKGWRLIPKWRRLLLATGCFVLGLVPYVYLPIAASRSPAVNWGNPTTVSGVLAHIARRQYTENAADLPPETWSRFTDQMGVFWNAATHQGATPLLIAGVVGTLWLLRRRFSLGLMLLGTAVMSTVVLILDINVQTDFENAYACRLFFVPAYLVLAIGGGWLIGDLLSLIRHRSASAIAGIVVAAGAVVPPLAANFHECDYSHYRIVAAHGRRLLNSIPLNAVVFPSSDHNTFPLIYLKFVEGLRPDVTIADKYGYIDPAIVEAAPFSQGAAPKTVRTKAFRAAIEGWVVDTWNRPVYFSSKGRLQDAGKYELVSEGLWYRARHRDVPAEQRAAADAAAWEAISAIAGDESPSPYDYSAQMVLSDLCFARARSQIARGDLDGAVANCRRAAEHVPLSKEVQNNLGSLLAEHGQHELARPFFQNAIELDQSYLTGLRNLAVTFQARHEYEEARPLFRRVLGIDPLDPTANRAMSQIAREEENWGEATEYLETVGSLERDARAFRDAGLIALYELKDLGRAKALLRVSLSLDRNQPEIADIEERIKKTGTDDESAKKKGGQDDPGAKRDQDPKERRARDLADKALGLPGAKEPTAPDPLGSLIPKPKVPAAPGVPEAGGGRPGAPNPPAPSVPSPRGGQ